MAKRKYTVSAKVIAANRRNLEKARAVPKSIRYRTTPRRLSACRENLLKANAQRPAATAMPRRHPVRGRSLKRAARRWGEEAVAWLKAQAARVVRALDPCGGEEDKLARGMAEGLGRWLALARERRERERQGLLRVWSQTPEDAVAAAGLGGWLLRLFREEAWGEKARQVLELRLERLARMFWFQRNMPMRALREALEEVTAQELGNPFQPPRSEKIKALLGAPEPELHVGSHLVLPELPGEDAENNPCSADLRFPGPRLSPGKSRTSCRGDVPIADETDCRGDVPLADEFAGEDTGATMRRSSSSDAAREWFSDFASYRRQVEQSLGGARGGAKLRASIERIARLSWERYQVAEREWRRREGALATTLTEDCIRMRADLIVSWALDALAGSKSEAAEAERLEEELEAAFQEYLGGRYGSHPVFELVRRPSITNPCPPAADEPAATRITQCKPIYVVTNIS